MEDKQRTVYPRALWRALTILGGKDELCRALGVVVRELDPWLDGRREPPVDIFLKTVDILSLPTQAGPPYAAAARAERLTRESFKLMGESVRVVEESRAIRAAREPTREARVRRFLDGWFDPDERSPMLEA